MPVIDPHALLRTLSQQPRETEWLEFKVGYFNADDIGEYVSGLANSAILLGQERAYLVFGVENQTHKVVGTSISIKDEKVGNEPFENWLCRWLDPRLNLEILEFSAEGKKIAMIIIDPAYERPVRFKNQAFIRIGSIKKLLREYHERERQLWAVVSRFSFERGVAATHLSAKAVTETFHCEKLLQLVGYSQPMTQRTLIANLLQEQLLIDDKQEAYDATNLLALVAARDLTNFPLLLRKAPRVISYQGSNKSVAIQDRSGRVGYAIAFTRVLKYIMEQFPQGEEVIGGKRVKELMYPEIAIREFLSNALIHQDLTVGGSSPTIEVYVDKIEITNPGVPLIETDRFIDAPPRSRNEWLAALMRRAGYAEERGSGIDRALLAIEGKGLPPPIFKVVGNSTVITILGKRLFSQMSREDRIRACYQHACLRYLSGDPMRNATLRARLGLTEKQYPQASIVIADTIETRLIKPLDGDQSNRLARYVPYWA